eukprot:5425245-Pleurochrysis_carterae.AAC.1
MEHERGEASKDGSRRRSEKRDDSMEARIQAYEKSKEDYREMRHALKKRKRALEHHREKAEEKETALREERSRALSEVRTVAEESRKMLEQEDRRIFSLDLAISEMRGRVATATNELRACEAQLRAEAEAAGRARNAGPARLTGPTSSSTARARASADPAPSGHAAAAPAVTAAPRRDEQPHGFSHLVYVINLDRRADRLDKMKVLPLGLPFKRIAALDGRTLEWENLVEEGLVQEVAALEARYPRRRLSPFQIYP